jgi:hypothetical protein
MMEVSAFKDDKGMELCSAAAMYVPPSQDEKSIFSGLKTMVIIAKHN